MGLFDFLHRPSGKNTQEVIKEVEKIPTMMSIYREDGTQTEVLNIEEAQKFRHSDGSISSLISARVIHVNQGDTIYLDAADPICFEIPEGRYDLAKELITRFTGMYTGIELNEKSYTYLGRAYSEEDIRLQPPTAVVNEQIGKLNEKLLEEITNKRLRESRLLEVRQKEENARNTRMQKNINKLRAEGQKKIEARMANPFIRGGLDKFQAEQYDGVNTSNGEILRIRAVNKIAKDASGRYVYTAQLASTSDEQNVELFSPDVKVPVVFTLPYRLNDIVNTEYEATYKKQLEKAVLDLLSNGYQKNITPEGECDVSTLHDIGGINKDGSVIENSQENGVSQVVISKIVELQGEYIKQRRMRENTRAIPYYKDDDGR